MNGKAVANQSKIMPRPKVWRDDAPSITDAGGPAALNDALFPPRRRSSLKAKGHKGSPLRDSARGELCMLQVAGVCNQDTETTVLCHLPMLVGAGMGQKAPDYVAAYGCSSCHDWIDSRSKQGANASPEAKLFYATRALVRTLARLVETGLVTIKGINK